MKKTAIKIIGVIACVAIVFSLGVFVGMGKQSTHTQDIQGIDYVSDEQVRQWREPVKKLVAELEKENDADSFFMSAFAYALFDVNLDGTPELIRALPGGSAGNATYMGYDIFSGELIAEFAGGNFSGDKTRSWCAYYNRAEEVFENIGIFTTSGGWDSRFKCISKTELHEDSGLYENVTMFYTSYSIETDIVDETLVERGVSAEYYVGKNKVEFGEFNYQYDNFTDNYIRIPQTAMEVVYVNSFRNSESGNDFAEVTTSALFETGQRFIAE